MREERGRGLVILVGGFRCFALSGMHEKQHVQRFFSLRVCGQKAGEVWAALSFFTPSPRESVHRSARSRGLD